MIDHSKNNTKPQSKKMNEKHIRFAIRTERDWFWDRRKADRTRRENIKISYGHTDINMLDIVDKGKSFDQMSKRIVNDWTNVEITNRNDFVFGLSNLDRRDVFPTREAEEILIEIVKKVLCRRFDKDFIEKYDSKTHEYLFDITFSINEKTCEVIDFSVKEYDEESIPEPTSTGGTYDVNFLIKVAPKRKSPKYFRITYHSESNCERVSLEDMRYYYGGGSSELFSRISGSVFEDWKNHELNKRSELILEKDYYYDGVIFSTDKAKSDFREIINKELYKNFPEEYDKKFDRKCHSYLFQLKIFVKKNVSKLISSSVRDIQVDDSFDTPMMKSLDIDRKLLLNNHPEDYHIFDHPYNCPWSFPEDDSYLERQRLEEIKERQKKFDFSFILTVDENGRGEPVFRCSDSNRAIRVNLELGSVAFEKIATEIIDRESCKEKLHHALCEKPIDPKKIEEIKEDWLFPFPSDEAEESLKTIVCDALFRQFNDETMKNYGKKPHSFSFKFECELEGGVYVAKKEEMLDIQPHLDALYCGAKSDKVRIRFILSTEPWTRLIYYKSPGEGETLSYKINFHSPVWKEMAGCIVSDWLKIEVGRRIEFVLGMEWNGDRIVFKTDELEEDFVGTVADAIEKLFMRYDDNAKHKLLFDLQIKLKNGRAELLSSSVLDVIDSPVFSSWAPN